MAGGIVRANDLFAIGGVVIGNQSATVTVNDRPVALSPSAFTPHLGCTPKTPWHCIGSVIEVGSSGVEVEGRPVLTQQARGTCAHGITTASPDVFIVSGGLGAGAGLAFAGLGKLLG